MDELLTEHITPDIISPDGSKKVQFDAQVSEGSGGTRTVTIVVLTSPTDMTTVIALSPAQTLQTTSTTYTYDVLSSTVKYIAFRFQPSSVHSAMQLDNVKYGANLAVNEGVNISRNLKMAVSSDNNFLKIVAPNSLSKEVIYSTDIQMVTEEKKSSITL